MHNTHLFAIFHFALSHSQNLQKLLYWKFLRQFFLFCCSCGSDASFHFSVCVNTVYCQCTHYLILRSVIFYKRQKIQGVAHNRWWPTAGYITLLIKSLQSLKNIYWILSCRTNSPKPLNFRPLKTGSPLNRNEIFFGTHTHTRTYTWQFTRHFT